MPETINDAPNHQEQLGAYKAAEANMMTAEASKESAITELGLFKKVNAQAIKEKTLTAEQTATMNDLKGAVILAKKIATAMKSLFEIEKFKSRKEGVIVVTREVFRESDSPEIREMKKEISKIREEITERAETLKTKKKERSKKVEALDKEITDLLEENRQSKLQVADIRKKIGEIDPSQKPKEKSEEASKRGRKSRWAGYNIRVHSDFQEGENPCRSGSSAAKTLDVLRESGELVYEEIIERGVPSRDISTLIENGKLIVGEKTAFFQPTELGNETVEEDDGEEEGSSE